MIISITGKIESGKDTVAKLLLSKLENFTEKKFASPLKNTLCSMIGCTREQLEDHEFKNTPLGEEWWYYSFQKQRFSYFKCKTKKYLSQVSELIKPTPRMLMQDIGKAMRAIHPDVFVNEVMSDYKIGKKNCLCGEGVCRTVGTPMNCQFTNRLYPNWVISDLRFRNEHKVVEEKGIVIRVERSLENRFPKLYKEYIAKNPLGTVELFEEYIEYKYPELDTTLTDVSEIDLDGIPIKNVITNNSTLEDLEKQIDEFIKKNRL